MTTTQVYRDSVMPPLCLRYASVVPLIGLHRLIGRTSECFRNQNMTKRYKRWNYEDYYPQITAIDIISGARVSRSA